MKNYRPTLQPGLGVTPSPLEGMYQLAEVYTKENIEKKLDALPVFHKNLVPVLKKIENDFTFLSQNQINLYKINIVELSKSQSGRNVLAASAMSDYDTKTRHTVIGAASYMGDDELSNLPRNMSKQKFKEKSRTKEELIAYAEWLNKKSSNPQVMPIAERIFEYYGDSGAGNMSMRRHIDNRMLNKDLQRLGSLPQKERERIVTNLPKDLELQNMLIHYGAAYKQLRVEEQQWSNLNDPEKIDRSPEEGEWSDPNVTGSVAVPYVFPDLGMTLLTTKQGGVYVIPDARIPEKTRKDMQTGNDPWEFGFSGGTLRNAHRLPHVSATDRAVAAAVILAPLVVGVATHAYKRARQTGVRGR